MASHLDLAKRHQKAATRAHADQARRVIVSSASNPPKTPAPPRASNQLTPPKETKMTKKMKSIEVSAAEESIVLLYRFTKNDDPEKARKAKKALRVFLEDDDEPKKPPKDTKQAIAQLKGEIERVGRNLRGGVSPSPQQSVTEKNGGVEFGNVEAARARMGISSSPAIDHHGGHRIRALTPAEARAELARRSERNG